MKVYMDAIITFHAHVENRPIGRNYLIIRFLKGARRLNPPRSSTLPTWDLALELDVLTGSMFEPIKSASLWLGYVPNVLSTSFKAQVITLSPLNIGRDLVDTQKACLCPSKGFHTGSSMQLLCLVALRAWNGEWGSYRGFGPTWLASSLA